jgi:hypothetical protein
MANDTPAAPPLNFSAIPGHISHDENDQPTGTSSAERVANRTTELMNVPEEIGKLTEPIENYTQEGRAEHPILSKIGDVTRGVKELLEGGQAAGKPLGTSEGVVNNPVTNAIAMAPEAAAAAPAIGEGAIKIGEHLAETGRNFGRGLLEEGKAALEAKAPEGSLEAGFAKIPGYKKITNAPKPKITEPVAETPKPKIVENPAPNEQVAASAQRYNTSHGRPEIDHAPVELPSQEVRNEMADKFSQAKHEPENPAVARSYDAMKKETLEQFNHAKNDLGITFDFTKEDPYDTAAEMQADLRNNHHLSVYTGGNELPPNHPLAEKEPSTGQTYNDIFRGTHDVFGHSAGGHDFSEAGEENAYNAHKQMYSPEARPAVQNETQGQSNWYFNSEKARNGGERGFPEQKATIVAPETTSETEVEGGDPNLEAGDASFNYGANAYHPDLQKLADKYGVEDDPYKTSNGKSFITPDGKFIHISSLAHDEALGLAGVHSEGDNRIDFITNTGAIRTSYEPFAREGKTFHISVPPQGVTEEQIPALKAVTHKAVGKYGNIVIERADISNATRDTLAKTKEFGNANHIEQLLKDIDAHPGPKPWMEQAAVKAKQGGFTAHPTGTFPTEGRVAEIRPESRLVLDHPPTAQDIQEFTKKNQDLLNKYPELHVGGFGNELNISALGKNADRAARKLDQKSIYDLGKDKEIHTGGAGQRAEFSNYPMEDRLKDFQGKTQSDIPGFESLSKDFHDNLEPDERKYLKDNNLLQSNAMKQYHSIQPSVPETTNAMAAGASLGGWWQRYMDIFQNLVGGEQEAKMIGPSHAETLKQWHVAVSGNKSVQDANNLAWHSYADWLEAGKPTDRKSIDDIVRQNGKQPFGSSKKGNASMSDTRTASGKIKAEGLDTSKLYNLVNSPEMKGQKPFHGEIFNEENPHALANKGEGARKLPSMGATVAGKGNLNRLVIDAHIRDFYGHKNSGGPAAQYIADSVHLRQAAKALGLKGGEGQEQLWGTVLGLKTLLKEGLIPEEAAGKLDGDVINSIGKDYAEVIANDPEITKPGEGVLDRLKQLGIGKGSAGISQENIPSRSASTSSSGPRGSQEAIDKTELAKTAGRIRESISDSRIKKTASDTKKPSDGWLRMMQSSKK